MPIFDFNDHFLKYNSNTFFIDSNLHKTYRELLNDISCYAINLKNIKSDKIALKIRSPYLQFVAILACISQKKIPVLISFLEPDSMVLKLKSQVYFETILTDKDIISDSNVNHFIFSNINFNDPSLIIFSSGSSSIPKGVVLSFNNILYSALGFSQFFNQNPKERSIINIPHHHIGGLMILWRSFFSGGSITPLLELPADYISLVPAQLKRMIQSRTELYKLQNIKVILIGGSKLTKDLANKALSLGLKLFETYGMSETTSVVSINGVSLPYRKLELNEFGFFKIKGDVLALGHYKNNHFIPFLEEWLLTTDQGELDAEGKYCFVERRDLIFISGGENINPLFVEDVLRDHPNIQEVYLTSIKDETWGDLGVLLYESKDDISISDEDFKIFCNDKLHPYLIPKFFFRTIFKNENQLKFRRSTLKDLAYEYYLKKIFSYDFLQVTNKPLIVFLHGFLGNKNDLKLISQNLVNDYSCLYISLPGHGETLTKYFNSQNDFFNKLSDFIKLFSISPIFYGYSMGGRIALHLALHFISPQLLILESAGLGLQSINDKDERLKNDLELFKDFNQDSLISFLTKWYQNPIFTNYNQLPIFQNDIEEKSTHNILEWKNSQNFLSSGCFPILSENLKDISEANFKICYIYGENDFKFKNNSDLLEANFNRKYDNTISSVKNGGHNLFKTYPTEIAHILTKTLKFSFNITDKS